MSNLKKENGIDLEAYISDLVDNRAIDCEDDEDENGEDVSQIVGKLIKWFRSKSYSESDILNCIEYVLTEKDE